MAAREGWGKDLIALVSLRVHRFAELVGNSNSAVFADRGHDVDLPAQLRQFYKFPQFPILLLPGAPGSRVGFKVALVLLLKGWIGAVHEIFSDPLG